MMTYEEMAKEITNVRYGKLGRIEFDFEGHPCRIAEPKDVLLVGYEGAALWIAQEYGWMLSTLTRY